MHSMRAPCLVLAFAFISSSAAAQGPRASFTPRPQSLPLEETFAPQRSYAPTRMLVTDPTGQKAGSVTIDTNQRALYLSLGGGQAIRYGVGVGRAGFEWRGRAHVGRKAEWPSWTPPAAMLKRRPDLPRFMNGGINNPLGARALYLYNGGRDTLFRIHGTNEPWTIGQAVSSGCIRMMNDDVMDLYSRVRVGASVRMI